METNLVSTDTHGVTAPNPRHLLAAGLKITGCVHNKSASVQLSGGEVQCCPVRRRNIKQCRSATTYQRHRKSLLETNQCNEMFSPSRGSTVLLASRSMKTNLPPVKSSP